MRSEIVSLIESGQRRLLADIDKRNLAQHLISIREVHNRLSTGQLPPGAVEGAGVVRDFNDLLRREQEMKERFTRDILKLESERRNL